ncbi:ubiquitin-protein ligase/zinc ion binding protein, partial [Trifolium pratense]
ANNSWLSDTLLQMQTGPGTVLWRLFVHENLVSVKRSPLSDEDDKSHEVNDTKLGFMQPIAETVGDEVVAKRSLTCPDEQLVKLEKVEGLDPDKSLTSSTKPSPNEQYQVVKLEKVEVLDTDKPLASSIKPSPDEQYQVVKLEKVEVLDTDKPLASSTKPSPDEQYQLTELEKVEGSDTDKPLASSTKASPDEQYFLEAKDLTFPYMITKKRGRWPRSTNHHWKGLRQRITTLQNVAPISYSKLPLKKAQHEKKSRVVNVAPISYSKLPLKKAQHEKKSRVVIKEVSQPEVYTEEHDKLLGNTDKTWKLFVDGVGKEGKRIYDSFRGKTCHQCR